MTRRDDAIVKATAKLLARDLLARFVFLDETDRPTVDAAGRPIRPSPDTTLEDSANVHDTSAPPSTQDLDRSALVGNAQPVRRV